MALTGVPIGAVWSVVSRNSGQHQSSPQPGRVLTPMAFPPRRKPPVQRRRRGGIFPRSHCPTGSRASSSRGQGTNRSLPGAAVTHCQKLPAGRQSQQMPPWERRRGVRSGTENKQVVSLWRPEPWRGAAAARPALQAHLDGAVGKAARYHNYLCRDG